MVGGRGPTQRPGGTGTARPSLPSRTKPQHSREACSWWPCRLGLGSHMGSAPLFLLTGCGRQLHVLCRDLLTNHFTQCSSSRSGSGTPELSRFNSRSSRRGLKLQGTHPAANLLSSNYLFEDNPCQQLEGNKQIHPNPGPATGGRACLFFLLIRPIYCPWGCGHTGQQLYPPMLRMEGPPLGQRTEPAQACGQRPTV